MAENSDGSLELLLEALSLLHAVREPIPKEIAKMNEKTFLDLFIFLKPPIVVIFDI
jgi:hypothetical protein